jgi:TRAP-type uncharacterized transport system substrate-binding protein
MKSYVKSFALIAALASSSVAAYAGTTINLCTGAEGGPYAQIGDAIAEQLRGDPNVTVNVIKNTGGTWGNIVRTTGVENSAQPTEADYSSGAACHAFIGQPDGTSLLKRKNPAEARKVLPIGTLHTEYLHVLINKESGYDDLGDLEGRTDVNLAVGESGSGGWLLWDNLVYEDAGYKDVPTSTLFGDRALAAVAEGEITAMLVPAGIPNATVMKADELFGDQLVLAGANDKDFNDSVDEKGKPLYVYGEIPSGAYPKNLQGWFSSQDTLTWKAKVYVNTGRIDTKAQDKLITAVARVRPWAQAQFGGGEQ